MSRHVSRRAVGLVALVALLGWTRPAAAQEETAHEAGAGHGEVAEWREHPNSLGLFVGATIEEGESAFTLGLDYERRLHERFGVGLLADNALGGLREFIVAPAFFVHPVGELRIDLAPGVERKKLDDGEVEWEFLFRVGADYDFHLAPRWSIAPNANLDFVGGRTVWVLGAEITHHF